MSGYNTKVEGHKGEAARLEQMARDLLKPAAQRKEIAAELRARAASHWAMADEALRQIEGFDTPVEDLFDEVDEEVSV